MTKPGLRICYMGQIGTVRFSGPVEGTPGVWLGIEWDDPTRGKHDGTKDGTQYFSCLVPGAGSFLRPSATICYGQSFLEALKSKYVEAHHGSGSQELVILGSSRGAVQVEAVNLDKIREKLSNLLSLREASLDEVLVARGDPPGTIRSTCPNIRGLDLSKSLIHSWDTVAAIARELPYLERLYLNRNRFQRPVKVDDMMNCFDSLAEIRLNNTLMNWQDIKTIIAAMPKLEDLEAGYNRLTDISPNPDRSFRLNAPIQTVNLDSNQIRGWPNICAALLEFPFLQRLVLANNQIETIPHPTSQQGLEKLKHLSLSSNRLKTWSDISALASWVPSLESLALTGNPITTDYPQNARHLVIARLATLRVLDGTVISTKERRDAELYYLSYIASHGPVSEDEQRQEHPRWQDLCAKYGEPDQAVSKAVPDTLKSRLLELKLYRGLEAPGLDMLQDCLNNTIPTVIRVLPTMTLKNLRAKVRKALGYNIGTNITILMAMGDGTFVPLEPERDSHDLSWTGFEDGSQLICYG